MQSISTSAVKTWSLGKQWEIWFPRPAPVVIPSHTLSPTTSSSFSWLNFLSSFGQGHSAWGHHAFLQEVCSDQTATTLMHNGLSCVNLFHRVNSKGAEQHDFAKFSQISNTVC